MGVLGEEGGRSVVGFEGEEGVFRDVEGGREGSVWGEEGRSGWRMLW